jgi:uncharacterized membrane protein
MSLKRVLTFAAVVSLNISYSSCDKTRERTTVSGKSGAYFPAVKEIIDDNCVSCHDPSGEWSGRPIALNSDSLVVLNAARVKSAIADPVTRANKRMPIGAPLSAVEVNTIVKWQAAGGRATD